MKPPQDGAAAMTPDEYLSQHAIRQYLKSRGLTDKQLEDVRFRYTEGDEFRDWRIRTPSLPVTLLNDQSVWSALRAWCALRWLILDHPDSSRNTRDAWDYIALHLAGPILEAGRKQLQHAHDQGRQSHDEALSRHKPLAGR